MVNISSNSNAGSTEPKIESGALSNFNTQKTESKSNGNFSGGDINFDVSKLGINNPFDTKEPQQPTFDVDSAFKPSLSGNLDINTPNNNNINTTYSNNSSEPTMTVDEVYGKSSNQPVVEKQGDYSVSSNEKSNVKTSTFGKQDEISVTPTSVTENKGIVNNSTIQSVEGLNFQQKDKASVDVLDSKKKRDEVEAEDKSNKMRDKIKSTVTDSELNEGVDDFQISEEVAANEKAALDAAKDRFIKISNEYKAKLKEQDNINKTALKAIDEVEAINNEYNTKVDNLLNSKASPDKVEAATDEHMAKLIEVANKYGVDISSLNTNQTFDVSSFITSTLYNKSNALDSEINALRNKQEEARKAFNEAEYAYNNAFVGETNTPASVAEETPAVTPEPTPESQPTPQSGAETSYKDAMGAIENSENATPEQKAQAEEALTNLEDSRQALEDAAVKARSGNPADMVAYQEALKKYNENLKKAQEIGNRWTQTDFNEEYTRAVAKANDFKVTLADGTEMEYSDFATEEATKSPQYAKAMYEAKAKKYEDENHPILAKIERIKAEWSQTWLGSKLTFADNKVRDQFTQMAKTDMRATYAAYNNVLNDPNATPEKKEEASTAIKQANALMTASAALQASTGFLSGIGDSMDDGVYGTTDPKTHNAWQKTLNTVDNLIKITLGLGISPAANKAYQNMYYMAGAKVNESGLFTTDFDGDGFVLCQEYGNHAATGMIAGAGELSVGVAMMFNPASASNGLSLIVDSVNTFLNGLYGVRNEAEKSQKYTQEVLEYFKEAESIAESSGNEEAVQEITNAITQIENFELNADEVGNIDNWLEGSGSNTATNEKFNQSLSYDEWLKLIEADPTMQEYAKKLIAEKKEK